MPSPTAVVRAANQDDRLIPERLDIGQPVRHLRNRQVHCFGKVAEGAENVAVLYGLPPRLLWRFEDPPPVPEQNPLGPWLEQAGRFTHHLLNVLLMAIPVLGMIGLFADGRALPILGLTEIASPWGKEHALAEALVEVHGVFANALMIVAALHAAAAIFHHSVLRDRTLVRMLPHRLDS
jgi:cytochrome b561